MRIIAIRCGGCRARIKAPLQLRGQVRSCPGCGHRVVVQFQPLEDEGPALVYDGSSTHATVARSRAG
jgi:hypothetical protein